MIHVATRIKFELKEPPNQLGEIGLCLRNTGQIIVLVCKYFNGTSVPEIDG